MKIPTTLIIMDGYGLTDEKAWNAIRRAATPVLDRLFAQCPWTTLDCSGESVGLPVGQMGNSEVGHTTIGAGRVVYQDLPRISAAIRDGSFYENAAFLGAVRHCEETGAALHLMGLLSDGGVHSHNSHTWAFLKLARDRGLKKVYIHCFMDGRDVPPQSGIEFVRECGEKCAEIGVGKIATVMGRYYAMDRDGRWERIERAYAALVNGEGVRVEDPVLAMSESYENGVTDEFVAPVICDTEGVIKPGDAVIFTNFRPDRARELTRALTEPEFEGFSRRGGLLPLHFVCTTRYDESFDGLTVAFGQEPVTNTLGEYISKLGLTQLRVAETEKYAHVTFFLNGGEEKVFPGEDRVLIPSPKEFPTYDLVPEMSAFEVAARAEERILSGEYDVVIVNFANCDMVGHTGVFEAAVSAVQAVDTCVGIVQGATFEMGGVTLVTADHGNAERMRAGDGVTPDTAHTTNGVPFIICGADVKLNPGGLSDIAPTILDLLGLKQPGEMTGRSLIAGA